MPITAQDHSKQGGYDDQWLRPGSGQISGGVVSGWLGISQAYQAGELHLTPNQDDTLKRVLQKMVADIDQLVASA